MFSIIKKKLRNFIRDSVPVADCQQNTQVTQTLIANQYILMKKLLTPEEMPSFQDVGFKVHSEFEEDGILLYIFSVIGTTNRRVVEICAGDGINCNAANLIVNHGWEGLLFDGEKYSIQKGTEYYAKHPSTFLFPPKLKHAWLTRDNINHMISDSGFTGEIDLLSLDIDGNDYYLMDAISVIKPRVIICETHNVIPGDLALTIPYKEDFYFLDGKQNPEFRSVSLLAMQQLLKKKGYRLIGSHRFGFNAIFMLSGTGETYFPEISVESVLDNSYTHHRRETVWPLVKDLPWQKIE